MRVTGGATLGMRDVMTALGAALTERGLVGSFRLTYETPLRGTERVNVKLRVEPMGPPSSPWEQWRGYVLEANWSVNHTLTLEGLMYRMVMEAYCANEGELNHTEPST